MSSTRFDYAAPTSLAEAVSLLEARPGAKAMGGGHRLLVDLKLKRRAVPLVVDLRKIPGLSGVTSTNGSGLVVGALTSLAELLGHAEGALADAIRGTTEPQVRNQRTMGGAAAANDRAAHVPAALLALGAEVTVAGGGGATATMSYADYLGGRATSSERIITSVRIPAKGSSAYRVIQHAASGQAIAGVAAQVVVTGGKIGSVSLAVTGAADRPQRLASLESALSGMEASADLSQICSKHGVSCRTDLWASAEYRNHIVGVLAADAVRAAAERAT
ncbi:MAG: FAD binding domain-containing protein [Deltaproteobacteria bacterium]|nr:FAD binding domain-containing protein [Deltaproteobacteria bacterium]